MGEFSYGTSRVIAAPPAQVHALINDFRNWQKWSPWEDLDPQMERLYRGAEAGLGAEYEWSGNKKAGAGSMQIVESTPERIRVQLRFTRPFKSENASIFDVITTTSGDTDVRWTMTGEQGRLQAAAFKLFRMEKQVLKDFDRGLGRLAAVASS